MKSLIILGAGIIQIPVIRKAKELSYHTIVVDYDEQAPGIQYADEFYNISTNDKCQILALAKEKKVDGILTTSDYPVNVVAYVSQALGLPGMSEKLAEICTNKYLQRSYFFEHQINVPRFRLITSFDALTEIDYFPCIIKPVDSSASRGVKKVDTLQALQDQFAETLCNSKSGQMIVEEYIEGKEYSVETLSQHRKHHIIQITEKLTIGEDQGYFVEDTHIEPARLSEDVRRQVECSVLEILDKLQVDNCPTHTELKINKKGIFVVEIACRLGGDYITSDLVPLSTGVDMLGNLIKLSLGMNIDVSSRKKGVAAVQFLNDKNYERCVAFIEKENLSIVKSEVYPYESHLIKDSLARLGYIILHTDSQDEMRDILLKIK